MQSDFIRFPALRWVGALVLLGFSASDLTAEVRLATLFREGAVLQREAPLPVWGQAQPGEKLRVTFKGQSAEAEADESGAWRVVFAPQAVSVEPSELMVQGSNTLRVGGMVVGDLWLCSGQSNMGFVVARGLDAEKEIAAADFPLIRQFHVANAVADQPARTAKGEWVKCSPETAGNFSGAAYFFAREMFRSNGVPVGILHASWGGTQIESWMSADALAADPSSTAIEARWQKRLADHPRKLAEFQKAMAAWESDRTTAATAGKAFTKAKPSAAEGPGSPWQPSGLYNAMIAPFVPAALRGVLWYQGEANAPRAEEYASLFQGMIQQWRRDFGQELPFYFVQLANHNREFDKTRTTWAALREAQAEALALPKTGMAVAIEIGEVDEVHPRNKQEVGRRLALIAMRQLEGRRDVHDSGPIFKASQTEGGAIRVSFEYGDGLHSRSASIIGVEIVGVEIAGADRKFFPATARIDGATLVATADQVPAPVAIRYAWHNYPDACLFGRGGLPVAPFRSHRWD